MQKWQYLWMIFDKADSSNIETSWNGKRYKGYEQCNAVLKQIGELGWELVDMTSSFNSYGQYQRIQMIFKRPEM